MKIQTDTQQFFFKHGNEIIAINLADIFFFERMHRKSIIHTPNRTFEVNDSLIALEKGLNDRFFRSHRSYIINIDRIEKIISWKAKSYSIILNSRRKIIATHKKITDE